MCFTQPVSGALVVLGFLVAFFIRRLDRYFATTVLYFTAMEIIQFLSYFWIGECDSWINKGLTSLGFLHICFQPWFLQHAGVGLASKEDLKRIDIVKRLSIIGGICMLLAHVFAPFEALPVTEACPSGEWQRGMSDLPQCTYMGNLHLAWRVHRMEPRYYVPSSFIHFFLMFAPYFLHFKNKLRMLVGALHMLTGPFLAIYLTDNLDEQAAIWCFNSIFIIAVSTTFRVFIWKTWSTPKEKEV